MQNLQAPTGNSFFASALLIVGCVPYQLIMAASAGLEPAYQAPKARVLPLNDKAMVLARGFEPL